MQSAHHGDILDLDYVGGFYAELAPVRLNYVAALNRVAGPDLTRAFDYCELGCGLGETTLVLAASCPAGRFLGVDLSPAHIDTARRLADDGSVSNVRFLAADVAQLDPGGLPDFDYITLHGLYAWIPEPVRQAIDAFIARKLKPGGLLHVSYNAQPGACNMAILRRCYLDRARRLTGSLLERADVVTRELESLRAAGAPLFQQNPTAAKLFEIIRNSDRRYLVHEMFVDGWQPLAFSDVHDRMSAAGLKFVGDSEVLENFVEHCTLPDWTAGIADATDRLEQESLKDLVHNRSFRRDVFRRPHPADPNPAQDDLLLNTLLCTTQPAADVSPHVSVTGGKLDLSGPWFDRVRELLDRRVLSVHEILGDPVLASCPRPDLLDGLKLATIDGALGPALSREACAGDPLPSSLIVAPPLNRALLRRFDFNRPQIVLASPVTGRGVTVSRIEAMVLAAIHEPSPEEWMLARMQQAGISLKPTGTTAVLESRDDQIAALRAITSEFLRLRAPKLASLGVLVPRPGDTP